jgi:hypothetical protein
MPNDHQQVSIHIDKQEYKSPNPTTGASLYKLGSVGADYDLYQEVPGKDNDPLIPNNETEIHLKNGEHFYTAQKKLNPGGDGKRTKK